MKFQLVLQFPAGSLNDYDSIVALEEVLINELSNEADVDGHDMGSGESNIFIFSSAPEETFRQIQSVLDKNGYLESMIAAYRDADSDRYTIIWPKNTNREFRIL